jgi:methylglyoxal synthase
MKVKIYYAEIAPELESTEFDLNSVKVKGECIIGRSPECGLVLEGPDLSRQHAKFLSRDGNYYFVDLGSRNGSLVNGELSEPNREYLLNSGDKIRIGDFILNIEHEEELASTVFKVIDPSFFKAKQPQVEDPSEPEEIVSQTLPIDGLTERVILIVDNSIATDTPASVVEGQQSTALVEDELEEIAKDTPDSVEVQQPLVLVNDEFDVEEDIPTPAVEEQPPSTLVNDEDEADEENLVDRVIEEQPVSALVTDEFDDEDTPDLVIEEQSPSALVGDGNEENLVDRVSAEQLPMDLVVDELNQEDSPVPVIAEQPLSELVNDELDNENILDRVSQEYPLPTLADDEWVEEDLSENLVLEEQSASALVVDEFDEEGTPDRAIEEQPASALVENEFEEEGIPDRAIEEQLESDLVVDKLEEADISEHRRATDAEDELSASDLNKDIPLETPSTISTAVAVAGVVSGFNANNNGLGAELLNKKQIVLIAHDTKVADLTDIVDRHKDFLAKCLTISWTSIADSLRQETGMVVSKEIPSGAAGGFQNIAGLVNSGDVLAVIFLKDFFAQSQTGQANEEALLRLCNINEILLATNITTADALVHYLQS